ncbi:hypothetical protein RRG08_045452 [Elysia crispata]|uniref:Uncharacterized protein n=1 Tax=Elysia crispata TaxID=231223 RepID=A0AAE1AYZ8_9GAST|nr:hypothetical protein RRG08_045452 [Elysia crispata]
MEVQKTYACFIDFIVKHSEMVEALERTGIDGKDIRNITELYWNQKVGKHRIACTTPIPVSASGARGQTRGIIWLDYTVGSDMEIRNIEIYSYSPAVWPAAPKS